MPLEEHVAILCPELLEVMAPYNEVGKLVLMFQVAP